MATAPRILVLNGYGLLGGDVQTNVLALRNFEPGAFQLFAISKPRGEVYEQLKRIPGLKIYSMEMGNGELSPPRRSSKYVRAIDFFAAIPRIAAFVKRHRIDAIYTIDRSVDPNLGALVSRATNCPLVLNAAFPYYPQSGAMARFTLRQATRIQVHSQFLLDRLKPYVQDPARFKVVQHGLEIEKYDLNARGDNFRASLGIAADTPVVVMMGRLDPFKGQDDLIKAAAIVLRDHPEAQFLISGRAAWGQTDALKHSLEELIARLGVGRNVRLIGYVPSIPEFVAAANIVAMPSHEEPYGLVAMEGMAMARPVVATRAGGVPEFVLDQQVGLLVPPRNPEQLARAIACLAADPQRALEMGKRGRQRIEQHHTARQYASRVADLLYEAVHYQRRAV